METPAVRVVGACLPKRRRRQAIPDLLRQWAAKQRPHAGVVFGDRHTVPPNDTGAVAAALARLVA